MRWSKELPMRYSADVVVCGGGFAGFAAAYAAAREGEKVLLLERGWCLGGVGTSGLVNHILGVRLEEQGQVTTCVGGLFRTLEKRLIACGGGLPVDRENLSLTPHGWYPCLGIGLIFDQERMKLLLEELLTEVGVQILYGTEILDAVVESGRLKAVIACNKSGMFAVSGNYFVDGTGDGDILYRSGCAMEQGDETGGLAPASLELHVEHVDLPVLKEYMARTGDLRFRRIIRELREKGEWPFAYEIFISVNLMEPDVFLINTIRQVGVDGTDGESMTAAVLSGRKENYQLLEIARKHFPGFAYARVREIGSTMGIRETRRLQGEYVLSASDLICGTDFPDSIAMSAYDWDLPDPRHPSLQPLLEQGISRQSPYTEIPYRCLLPREIENLIAVGRCISVERDVLGPVRVMGPCIAMGEAAGIAAHLAMHNGTSFRNVNVQTLKQMIRAHGGMTDREQIRNGDGTDAG